MKKFNLVLPWILLIACIFFQLQLNAQAPQKMSYQAVIRNSNNVLVTSTAVGMKISVLQGSITGKPVYIETQKPTTNTNGLVTVEIGSGTTQVGLFSEIDWANGPYFIKTETDPNGGSNYTISGTNELLSVPYALFSANGLKGPQGPIGLAGPTGEKGADGAAGVQGEKGDPGIQGLPGKDGIGGVTIAGNNITITGTGTNTDPYIINAKEQTLGTTPGEMQYWNGTSWIIVPPGTHGQMLIFSNGIPTWASTSYVINPTTGKIWMDRNLGAKEVASSSSDVESFGDLYQWGRGKDGHQLRTSNTTTTFSTTDVPGHNKFILADDFYGAPTLSDWRISLNNNLWQGLNGVNNPCPSGYRIPTENELVEEYSTWSSQNAAGAFLSPLKLPMANGRNIKGGILTNGFGGYWSSTVNAESNNVVRFLYFHNTNVEISNWNRANGCSIRCIKDY